MAAKFAVSPEPLPLGEVDLRSKDGEGEDASQESTPPDSTQSCPGVLCYDLCCFYHAEGLSALNAVQQQVVFCGHFADDVYLFVCG